MPLKDDIANWDKRSAWVIREIYKRHHKDISFVSQIIGLMTIKHLQNGTTWLLKYHLSNRSNTLSNAQIDTVYQTTPHLEDWQSRLHILQIMAYMPIPETRLEELETFTRSCMASDVKFVRAWAYDGFFQLALQHPQLRPQAEAIFQDANESETAGSVKARLRHIINKGFPISED